MIVLDSKNEISDIENWDKTENEHFHWEQRSENLMSDGKFSGQVNPLELAKKLLKKKYKYEHKMNVIPYLSIKLPYMVWHTIKINLFHLGSGNKITAFLYQAWQVEITHFFSAKTSKCFQSFICFLKVVNF